MQYFVKTSLYMKKYIKNMLNDVIIADKNLYVVIISHIFHNAMEIYEYFVRNYAFAQLMKDALNKKNLAIIGYNRNVFYFEK